MQTVSRKPRGLARAAIITQFYVELQHKPRNSRITHPTDFPCTYPKTSCHCASKNTPMTSAANFWWICWLKTSRVFLFFSVIGLRWGFCFLYSSFVFTSWESAFIAFEFRMSGFCSRDNRCILDLENCYALR